MTRSLFLALILLFVLGTVGSAYGKTVAVTTNKAGTINYSKEINFAARNGKPTVKAHKRKIAPVVKTYPRH
jgi:cytochrome oxidase Cu insertion factor (SCO1/SenC/PrrC family)